MIARRVLLQCFAAALASPVLADEDFQSMWERRIVGDAGVAQLVERRIENPRVDGSNPSPGTNHRARLARDPVCGTRGRRYFHIGRHLSWRCRRVG